MRIALFCFVCSLGTFGGCAHARASATLPAALPRSEPFREPPAAPLEPPPTIPTPDLFVAMPRLVANLNAARSTHGSPALHIDSTLSHIAGTAARDVARLGRGAEQRVVDDLNTQLARFSLSYRRVASAVVFAPAPDEALAALTPGLDPIMRYTGVAVAPAETFGAGYAVVMIVGE